MKPLAHIAGAATTVLLAACSGAGDGRNQAAEVNAQAQPDINAMATGPVLPVENAAGAQSADAPAAAPPPRSTARDVPPPRPRTPSPPPPPPPPPPPAPPPAPDPHAGHDMNAM